LAIIDFENRAGFSVSLYDLQVAPTYGLIMSGEPTERGSKRMLEELRSGKDPSKEPDSPFSSYYLIEPELEDGFRLPALKCQGWLYSMRPVNDPSQDASGLSVVWLVASHEDILSTSTIDSLKSIPWSAHASDFDF
jgi:hypothetical protein